jgi:hypothetical protein
LRGEQITISNVYRFIIDGFQAIAPEADSLRLPNAGRGAGSRGFKAARRPEEDVSKSSVGGFAGREVPARRTPAADTTLYTCVHVHIPLWAAAYYSRIALAQPATRPATTRARITTPARMPGSKRMVGHEHPEPDCSTVCTHLPLLPYADSLGESEGVHARGKQSTQSTVAYLLRILTSLVCQPFLTLAHSASKAIWRASRAGRSSTASLMHAFHYLSPSEQGMRQTSDCLSIACRPLVPSTRNPAPPYILAIPQCTCQRLKPQSDGLRIMSHLSLQR